MDTLIKRPYHKTYRVLTTTLTPGTNSEPASYSVAGLQGQQFLARAWMLRMISRVDMLSHRRLLVIADLSTCVCRLVRSKLNSSAFLNRTYAESSWHIIVVYTAHHSYALRYSNEWRGFGTSRHFWYKTWLRNAGATS